MRETGREQGCVLCAPRRRTLQLARQLKDRAVEAQACYSLGNTYTLLQDYERAIDYHLKHLIIAQDLNDRYTRSGLLSDLGVETCKRRRSPLPMATSYQSTLLVT